MVICLQILLWLCTLLLLLLLSLFSVLGHCFWQRVDRYRLVLGVTVGNVVLEAGADTAPEAAALVLAGQAHVVGVHHVLCHRDLDKKTTNLITKSKQ